MSLSIPPAKNQQITPAELTSERERIGVTQQDLAKLAGISPSLLCRIEAGSRTLTDDVAAALVDALRAAEVEREEQRKAIKRAVDAAMAKPHLAMMRAAQDAKNAKQSKGVRR